MPDSVTLIDVTLRDGGYVNGHSWSLQAATSVVTACAEARISLCEIGYFRPRRHDEHGTPKPAACCPPGYVARLREAAPGVTLVAMAHVHELDTSDYRLLADAGVSMVRFPARAEILKSLPPHAEAARAAGLRVTVNLIRASEVTPEDAAMAARLATDCGAEAFYLADSNGGMFPDDVRELVGAAAQEADIPLGFHAHDGLSLAFINSLTALDAGCTYLDASLAGMGKGGGNLCLELIVGYLRARRNAPHAIVPLVRTADTVLAPWKTGVAARCESMASSLLNMNIDDIAEFRAPGGRGDLISAVDSLPA